MHSPSTAHRLGTTVALGLLCALGASALPSTVWAQQTIRKKAFPSMARRPWIGLVLNPAKQGKGLEVSRVLRTSPAQKAGLQVGQVLVKAQGQDIASVQDFRRVVLGVNAGDALTLTTSTNKTYTLKLTALPSQSALIKSQWMGRAVPALSYEDIATGSPQSIAPEAGKVTVLEFWATWCGPCKPMGAHLDAYQAQHKDVRVFALSAEPRATIKTYRAKQPAQALTTGRDAKSAIQKLLMVRSYPTVLIFDDTMRLRKVLTGFNHPSDVDKAVDSVRKIQKARD